MLGADSCKGCTGRRLHRLRQLCRRCAEGGLHTAADCTAHCTQQTKHLEYKAFLPPVRHWELDLAIQPPRPQERRVQRVCPIGGHDDLQCAGHAQLLLMAAMASSARCCTRQLPDTAPSPVIELASVRRMLLPVCAVHVGLAAATLRDLVRRPGAP